MANHVLLIFRLEEGCYEFLSLVRSIRMSQVVVTTSLRCASCDASVPGKESKGGIRKGIILNIIVSWHKILYKP
jgi:hypothetical protein